MKTTKKQILEYWWSNQIDECLLNFDWSEAGEVCWNCASTTKFTQRCHIIPHALGGKDEPSNYVLLCEECHREAPDVNSSEAMWDWIKSNKNKYFCQYDMYRFDKAIQAFEVKYKVDFFKVFAEIPNVIEFFKEELSNISNHFGLRIKTSTYLYLIESIYLKKKKC